MHIADHLSSQHSCCLLHIYELFLYAFIFFTVLLRFIYNLCNKYWTHLQSLIFFLFFVLFLIFDFDILFSQKLVKWSPKVDLNENSSICLVGMGLKSFSVSDLSLITVLDWKDEWIVPRSNCPGPIRRSTSGIGPTISNPRQLGIYFGLLVYFQVY